MAEKQGFKAMPGGGVVASPGASGVSNSPDIDIYTDEIEMYLQDFFESRSIDPGKVSSMQWAAALMYVRDHVFRPSECLLTESARGTPEYNLVAVNALLDRYIQLCYTYQQRVCISHFCFLSGIDDSSIYRWKDDTKTIYIYDLKDGSVSSGVCKSGYVLTTSRKEMYKKLVKNTIDSADDLMLTKSGVNSIAYRNAVQERYSSRAAESVQALDVGSIADQLGIAGDVALLGDCSK